MEDNGREMERFSVRSSRGGLSRWSWSVDLQYPHSRLSCCEKVFKMFLWNAAGIYLESVCVTSSFVSSSLPSLWCTHLWSLSPTNPTAIRRIEWAKKYSDWYDNDNSAEHTKKVRASDFFNFPNIPDCQLVVSRPSKNGLKSRTNFWTRLFLQLSTEV